MSLKQVQAMVIDRQAIHKSQAGIWKSDITIPDKLNLTSMGGACRMASVGAIARPTFHTLTIAGHTKGTPDIHF